MLGLLPPAFGLIISQPSSQETHLGTSVLFEVEAVENSSIQWEFNGSPISGANAMTLEISDISLESAGYYRAKITSDNFSEYSDDAELKVNYFPAGELPRLVKDLNDRLSSTTPLREGVVFKKKLYYLRDNLSEFPQLWVTDGTRSNDRKYLDIADDAAGFFIRDGWHWGHNENTMYFEAPHTDSRWLWKTDGESNPIPLVQIDSGGSRTNAFSTAGFYFGNDGQLWLTDGTPEGTQMVSEVGPNTSGDRGILSIGEKVYYTTRHEGSVTLAVSDGTNLGTSILKTAGGEALRNIGDMMAVNERLYLESNDRFYRIDSNLDEVLDLGETAGQHGKIIGAIGDYPIIFSRKSGESTYKFNTVGPDDTVEILSVAAPKGEFKAGPGGSALENKIIFNQTNSLWVTDGTNAGTVQIHSSEARAMAMVGGRLFFSSNGDGAGIEPWITDGTAKGTYQIRDVRAGSEHSMFSGSSSDFLVALNDKAIFRAHDGHSTALWESDGTDLGTKPLIQPNFIRTDGSSIERGGGGNDLYFFYDGLNLMTTNGSNSETLPVKRLTGKPSAFFPLPDSTLYVIKEQLWRSDGSSEGTYQVTANGVVTSPLDIVSNGTSPNAYFRATSEGQAGVWKAGIWKTNGTTAGTSLVFDDSDLPGRYIENLQGSSDGRYVFFRRSYVDWTRDYFEPWVHDTVTGTTRRILRIEGATNSGPHDILEFNSQYWFTAKTPSGTHLYRSNGGQANFIKAITTGRIWSSQIWAGNNGFYFAINGDLWFSNGTAAGTVELGRFDNISNLVTVGEKAVFVHLGPENEQQLRVIGKTPGSDSLLKVLSNSPSGRKDLTAHIGRAYFTADDEQYGGEMWVTDGTIDGTRILTDSYPGVAGSNAEHHGKYQGKFYFSQNDGIHGEELWVIDDLGRIVINSQASSKNVQEGANVTLEIEANGSDLSYQWYAGRSGDTSIALDEARILQLNNVIQSGFYWCRVSNEFEQVDSEAALITVYGEFDFWLRSSLSEEASRGLQFDDDLEGDGNSLLAEFAFGGNPTQKEILEPFTIRPSEQNDEQILLGSLLCRKSGNLDYEVQVSDDLENWTTVPDFLSAGEVEDFGNGFENISVELGRNIGSYFRVAVSWSE